MSVQSLLVLLSPMLVLILVLGVVTVVALCRAQREDVPAVFDAFGAVVRWVADRLPDRGRNPTDAEAPSVVAPIDNEDAPALRETQ